MSHRTLTVAQLRAALADLPDDAPVYVFNADNGYYHDVDGARVFGDEDDVERSAPDAVFVCVSG